MTHAHRLLAGFALLLILCAYASESGDEIRALVPTSVTVESIQEKDGYVHVSGLAPSNEPISALMRAIDQSHLGDPVLESIERKDGTSRFRLRVKLPVGSAGETKQ